MNMLPSTLKIKNPLSQKLPKMEIHLKKWNSGPNKCLQILIDHNYK